MNGATIAAELPGVILTPEQGYARAAKLAEALGAIHSVLSTWWEPAGMSPKVPPEPFSNREGVIARAHEVIKKRKAEYPELDYVEGFSLGVNTAWDGRRWREDGNAGLDLEYGRGVIRISIDHPLREVAPAETARIVRGVLLTLIRLEPITFASTDVCDWIGAGKDREATWYSMEHLVFPHRQFFGWMGFVSKQVKPEDVPDAEEVIPVGNRGTVIIAMKDAPDLNNIEHVKRMNLLEMSLVDQGLLPVIDPSFG